MNMAPELIPSILCQTEKEVHERLNSITDLVEWVQLDVLDNTLYQNITWADPDVVKTWNLACAIELDLMVADPGKAIEAWKDVSSFKRAIWHIEAPIDHRALIKEVRLLGKEVGLSLAPDTDIATLEPYLSLVDRILVLGVQPGWSGQTLIAKTIETVHKLTSRTPHPVIAFDGGISDDTLPVLLEAGVEALCPNSLIFKHPPIKERIEAIRARLKVK